MAGRSTSGCGKKTIMLGVPPVEKDALRKKDFTHTLEEYASLDLAVFKVVWWRQEIPENKRE